MPIIKKKNVVVAPEVKIQEADIHVSAQQEHFRVMAQEVQYAIETRNSAITELNKEVHSLEAQLRAKKNAIENAQAQNQADSAFAQRIADEFIS